VVIPIAPRERAYFFLQFLKSHIFISLSPQSPSHTYGRHTSSKTAAWRPRQLPRR
jgi:hypothetical protein